MADVVATDASMPELAEFMRKLALPTVDHLSIDLNGLDVDVLKHVPWSSLRPSVVECRFNDDDTFAPGPPWRDVGTYLREQGYAVYVSEWHPTIPGGEREDWRRVVPFDEQLDVRPAARATVFAFRDDPGWPHVRESFHRHLERRVQRPTVPPPALLPLASEPPSPRQPDAVQPPRPRPFYASFARWLKPIPIVVLLTALALAGFVPALAPVAGLVWGSAALIAVALTMLFASLRLLAMRNEVIRLRRVKRAYKHRLSAASARIALLERGLADARSANTDPLQKVVRLEGSIAERRAGEMKHRRGA